MIEPIYRVRVFDPRAATVLIAITAIGGGIFGVIVGMIWNRRRH